MSDDQTASPPPKRPAPENQRTRSPGARPTLADIAQAAGVTRMTVSNALNGRDGVSADLRERIRTIASEMGYVTNWVAKKLSDSRSGAETGIIGVIAEIHTPFMGEVVSALSSAVRDQGRDMLVYSLPDPAKNVPGNVLDLLLHAVDGVIAVIPRDTSDFHRLATAGVPMVAVDRLNASVEMPSVAADSYGGACCATRHLIALGHRKIAFLAGETRRLSAQERLRGYRDSLRAAGLLHRPEYEADGGYEPQLARPATQALLALSDPPTAIFAGNDASALAAIATIEEAGLSVPGDISVIGFDDVSLAVQGGRGLTTIRQPFPEIGCAAVQLLLDLREGRAGAATRHLTLPVELIERATTAPPRR
ncbi:LacI family transcriptional regulator [Thioclava dalianensis]|uniref:LacI family transcriptional regulator n=1 Tax=Thioclava dalianensis TaxID=1185766 RepID=A0A074TDW9_9RHOB|nr:LacI family DNA-binding transcriptional regulator [Thioclava dalianensis]KEP68355.1 LacI family transcriptional regulator [Thioclava dalianensis]SFM73949.1 LacI family transcriptional regulator [Thioclava dalianensis]